MAQMSLDSLRVLRDAVRRFSVEKQLKALYSERSVVVFGEPVDVRFDFAAPEPDVAELEMDARIMSVSVNQPVGAGSK